MSAELWQRNTDFLSETVLLSVFTAFNHWVCFGEEETSVLNSATGKKLLEKQAEQMSVASSDRSFLSAELRWRNTDFKSESALLSIFTAFNHWVCLFWRREDLWYNSAPSKDHKLSEKQSDQISATSLTRNPSGMSFVCKIASKNHRFAPCFIKEFLSVPQ